MGKTKTKKRDRPRKERVSSTYRSETDLTSWSRLPLEIEPLIFRYLPLHTIAKAKSVCKRWLSVLTKMEERGEVQPPEMEGDALLPLLSSHNGDIPWFAYQACTGKWLRFPPPASLRSGSRHVRILSSRRSLILLEDSRTFKLHICNWSTGESSVLPDFGLRHVSYIRYASPVYWCHLHVDKDKQSYTVFAMLEIAYASPFRDSNWPPLARFDSDRGSWILLKPDQNTTMAASSSSYIPPAFFEDCNRLAFVGDSVYMVATSKFNTSSYLVGFDGNSSSWKLISIVPFSSATIVAFYNSFIIVALDPQALQIHLYRFFRHSNRNGGCDPHDKTRNVNIVPHNISNLHETCRNVSFVPHKNNEVHGSNRNAGESSSKITDQSEISSQNALVNEISKRNAGEVSRKFAYQIQISYQNAHENGLISKEESPKVDYQLAQHLECLGVNDGLAFENKIADQNRLYEIESSDKNINEGNQLAQESLGCLHEDGESSDLVLLATSGPELSSFVSDCAKALWFATAPSWPPCIYIGRKHGGTSMVEFNVFSKSWKHLPFPNVTCNLLENEYADSSAEEHQNRETVVAQCVCVEGYEVGLSTPVSWNGANDDDDNNNSDPD